METPMTTHIQFSPKIQLSPTELPAEVRQKVADYLYDVAALVEACRRIPAQEQRAMMQSNEIHQLDGLVYSPRGKGTMTWRERERHTRAIHARVRQSVDSLAGSREWVAGLASFVETQRQRLLRVPSLSRFYEWEPVDCPLPLFTPDESPYQLFTLKPLSSNPFSV